MTLKNIEVDELISKILADERDFCGCRIEGSISSNKNFDELQEYLKKSLSTKTPKPSIYPVLLKNSELRFVEMKGIYLPFLYAASADFTGANLEGAYLHKAYLFGADFTDANLKNACLEGVSLNGVKGLK
jgi:uncharacterized protein YjbI with pentapeptide repeats